MDSDISARAALLQALVSGDGYGLELIDRVREKTGGRVKLHQGSIYPALREMECEGLVRAYEADASPERGGRPRRYYKLTAAGARAATQSRASIAGLFGFLERAR